MPLGTEQSFSSLRVQEWDFAAVWGELRTNILGILKDPSVKPRRQFVQLDRDVHKLTSSDKCVNIPQPSRLVEQGVTEPVARRCLTIHLLLEETISEHIQTVVFPQVAQLRKTELIPGYVMAFDRYKLGMKLVQIIFRYLRGQAQRTKSGTQVHHETWQLGMSAWKEKLFETIKDDFTAALLEIITHDRRYNTMPVAPPVLRKAVQSLVSIAESPFRPSLAMYHERFEKPFLRETEKYCRWQVGELEARNSVSEYVVGAEKIIRQELRRVSECFDKVTSVPLNKVMFRILVEERLQSLFTKFDEWIDDKAHRPDLHRLHWLLRQGETGLDTFRKKLEDRIEKDGLAEVQQVMQSTPNPEPGVIMQAIFSVFSRYKELIVQTFDNHSPLALALDKGCRRFLNRNDAWPTQSAKAAETLAKYINTLLKANSRVDNFEEEISLCVSIFALLNDRDVFQQCHGSFLSLRLIYNNTNPSNEEYFINKIKQVCGHEFTYKWQRMFTDSTMHAPALRDSFIQHSQSHPNPLVPEKLLQNFTPLVLMMGSWPISASEVAQPPRQLLPVYEAFRDFYTTLHQGRKLQFVPSVSFGVVKAAVKGSKFAEYDLTVNHIQMCLLLAFNASPNETMDAAELKRIGTEVMGGSDQGVDRHISLLVTKKILNHDASRNMFSVNASMVFPTKKVNLLLTRLEGSKVAVPSEVEVVSATISDRKFAIQAAITRVMKARRTMTHSDLVAEVLNVLKSRFTATVQEVKANIDVLLEKDYLERNSQDSSAYNYVA